MEPNTMKEEQILPAASTAMILMHIYNTTGISDRILQQRIAESMIEFAKLHVQAALKEASEEMAKDTMYWNGSDYVDKKAILNSYPLENIK